MFLLFEFEYNKISTMIFFKMMKLSLANEVRQYIDGGDAPSVYIFLRAMQNHAPCEHICPMQAFMGTSPLKQWGQPIWFTWIILSSEFQ